MTQLNRLIYYILINFSFSRRVTDCVYVTNDYGVYMSIIEIINLMKTEGYFVKSGNLFKKTQPFTKNEKFFNRFRKDYGLNQLEGAKLFEQLWDNLDQFGKNDETTKGAGLDKWFENYMKAKGLSMMYTGQIIDAEGMVQDTEWFLAQISEAAFDSGMGEVEKRINRLFLMYKKEQQEEYRKTKREELRYDANGNGESELRKFVVAIKGGIDNVDLDRVEYDVKIIKHFIWQVKRKLNQLKVYNHIMPVFVGKTGSGKTYNIEQHLLEPLGDLSFSGNLSLLDDDREVVALIDHFVVFFDELAGAERVSVNNLKKYITSTKASYRILGKNAFNHGNQNSTFIATSNTIIRRAIYDPTSARRYWSIDCGTKPQVEPFYDMLNEIDYLAIWKCVDESSLEYPIKDSLREINIIQDRELRAQSLLEQYLEDEDYEIYNTAKTRTFVTTEILTYEFNSFLETLGRKPKTKRAVSDELKEMGYEDGREREQIGMNEHQQVRGWYVWTNKPNYRGF